MILGLNARTGGRLTGAALLRQSIRIILTTPIGSRVMRRDFGSLLPELLDHPANAGLRQRIFAATVVALRRWEPRLRLTRVTLDMVGPGVWTLGLEGVRTDLPPATAYGRLTLPLRARAAAA